MASSLQDYSDDDLVSLVREGRDDAYAELYRRHSGTALRYARRFVALSDAHDVAQEAFLRILRALRRDEGPRDGFVGYLLRTVRNLVTDRSRRTEAVPMEPVEIEEAYDELDPDHAHTLVERDVLSRAFASLPDQWQRVLWLTEVEGLQPRELVPEFAGSSNAVAQLSRRAREGLRGAWLQAHVLTREADPGCREYRTVLADYDRGRLGAARAARVDAHLVGCASCTAVLEDLRELSVRLPVLLLPVVLGGGASSVGGLAGAGAPIAAGGGTHDGASAHGAGAAGKGLRALASSSQGMVAAAVAAGVVLVAGVAIGATVLRGGGASPVGDPVPHATDSSVVTPPPGLGTTDPPPSAEDSPPPEALPEPTAPPSASEAVEDPARPSTPSRSGAVPERQPEPRPRPAPSPAPVPVPEPAPAPGPTEPTPGPTEPTPVPTEPTPDPTEPTEPEPPSAPTADGPAPGSYRTPVTLTGTAVPGALVEVVDQTGAVVATTTADATGSWTATPVPGAPDVATTYSAVQTSEGLSSPASAPTGAYVFEAPEILQPADGDTVVAWPGGLVPFTLRVPAGSPYTVTVDGVTEPFDAVEADTTFDYVIYGLDPGVHEITTRFVDPAGDGAVRRVVFEVVEAPEESSDGL